MEENKNHWVVVKSDNLRSAASRLFAFQRRLFGREGEKWPCALKCSKKTVSIEWEHDKLKTSSETRAACSSGGNFRAFITKEDWDKILFSHTHEYLLIEVELASDPTYGKLIVSCTNRPTRDRKLYAAFDRIEVVTKILIALL